MNPYTGKPGTISSPSSKGKSKVGAPPSIVADSKKPKSTTKASQPTVKVVPVAEKDDEEKAQAKLAMIRQLLEHERFLAAGERLRELIEEFPNTKAAAEAKKLLGAI